MAANLTNPKIYARVSILGRLRLSVTYACTKRLIDFRQNVVDVFDADEETMPAFCFETLSPRLVLTVSLIRVVGHSIAKLVSHAVSS